MNYKEMRFIDKYALQAIVDVLNHNRTPVGKKTAAANELLRLKLIEFLPSQSTYVVRNLA